MFINPFHQNRLPLDFGAFIDSLRGICARDVIQFFLDQTTACDGMDRVVVDGVSLDFFVVLGRQRWRFRDAVRHVDNRLWWVTGDETKGVYFPLRGLVWVRDVVVAEACGACGIASDELLVKDAPVSLVIIVAQTSDGVGLDERVVFCLCEKM